MRDLKKKPERKVVLHGGDMESRGSEARLGLVYSRDRQKTSVAGLEQVRRRLRDCAIVFCCITNHSKT